MKYAALRLLKELGIKYYTKRHLDIILEELKSQKPNAKKLLDELGSWDENDLAITKNFIMERERILIMKDNEKGGKMLKKTMQKAVDSIKAGAGIEPVSIKREEVLKIVDACFHAYASSYRADAKEMAEELLDNRGA